MSKVYLIMSINSTGMGCEDKPILVFQNKIEADKYCEKRWCYVVELDFIEGLE